MVASRKSTQKKAKKEKTPEKEATPEPESPDDSGSEEIDNEMMEEEKQEYKFVYNIVERVPVSFLAEFWNFHLKNPIFSLHKLYSLSAKWARSCCRSSRRRSLSPRESTEKTTASRASTTNSSPESAPRLTMTTRIACRSSGRGFSDFFGEKSQ